MICTSCKTDNSEEMKFCINCGTNLEGKIKCNHCNEWVTSDFNFCPFCSSKLIEEAPIKKEKKKKTNNRFITLLTNSIVSLLCIGLILVLLGGIANYEVPFLRSNNNTSENVIDFIDASIKGLSDLSLYDLESEFISINPQDKGELASLNFLNVFMIDEYDELFVVQRVMIYVNTILLVVMIILPIVLLSFTIKNFIKMERTNGYKKIFLLTLFLGLIMLVTIPMMGYQVGSATIFYLIFSSLGLLYSYIIELILRERVFAVKGFTLKLVSYVFLIILIFQCSTSVLQLNETEGNRELERINYGDIAILGSNLDDSFSDYQFKKTYMSELIIDDDFRQDHSWVTFVSFLIPLIMVTSMFLLIISIISETAKNLNLRDKRCHTTIYSWLSFSLNLVAIIVGIVVVSGYNDFFNLNSGYVVASISTGIIILTLNSFIFALYRTVTSKYLIQ